MKDIDSMSFSEAVCEWQNAPHKYKGATISKWCNVLGITPQTFHLKKKKEMIKSGNLKKRKRDAGQRKNPLLVEWAKTIVQVMAFVPKTTRKPPVNLAFEKAIKNGLLTEDALKVPLGTYCRVIREERLLEREKKIVRFEASRPMELWQMDASGSEYLYVAKVKNGEPTLRLRATKTDYKNKKQDGLRVWYYGAVDDHSGYWLAKAGIASGESSADNLNFFKWCACKKDDAEIPFYGLPEKVYMDNGPLSRAAATKEFFKRIDVELKTHEPNSAEDTGKIEVRWKPLWRRFEMDMLMDPHWDKVELTVTELNQRLKNFIIEQNRRQHRHLGCTRLEAWLTVIKNGGVVEIAPEAWDTAFATQKISIDNAGWFDFKGKQYEVKGIMGKTARAYRGLINGKVLVKDLQTNYIYEAKAAKYLEAGEYRADRKQEWENIKKESQSMKEMFAPGAFRSIYEKTEDTNVVCFPIKSTERTIDTAFEKVDPFAIQDAKTEIKVEAGAMMAPRDIVPAKMSIMELFRKLKDATGTISPALNQALRAEFGESIEMSKAEEVIREIEAIGQEAWLRGKGQEGNKEAAAG